MDYILNSEEIKTLEKESAKGGLSFEALMERAAACLVDFLFCQNYDLRVPVILCGPGNNGGDGLAAAVILKKKGISARVVMPLCDKLSELCALELERAKRAGVEFCESFDGATIIVDALFGIGLSRKIEGSLEKIIKEINILRVKKIAVDIPSGISSDTGEIMGCAVVADATVTFAYKKIGHVLSHSPEYCGKITVADIGVKNDGYFGRYSLTSEDLSRIPERCDNSNKGDYKKVLAIAGSKNMCGAAYLVSAAAYRSGAGLVKVHSDEKNRVIIQTLIPEALFSSGEIDLSWADIILIGPGIGRDSFADVKKVLEYRGAKKVVDADALNIISEHRELLELLDENTVITPHMGEMARLTSLSVSEIKRDPVGVAAEFHKKYKAVCLLKDARSVIASDSICINLTGNSGMAKGGSGDVLCGIIGGLLALGLSVKDSAELGAYISGLSGDRAAEKYGKHSMMARDIINSICEIFKMKEEIKK